MPYTINGQAQDLAAPVLTDDTTFVPLAGIIETLGGYVTFDNLSNTVSIELGDHKARVVDGNAQVEADGQTLTLQAAAYVEDNKMWVPVRFFEKALNCQIGVDGDHVTVTSA